MAGRLEFLDLKGDAHLVFGAGLLGGYQGSPPRRPRRPLPEGGFSRSFRAIGHVQGVGPQGPVTWVTISPAAAAEIRSPVLAGKDLLALGADEFKKADFSLKGEDAALAIFPDQALEVDFFAGPVDAALGEDVAPEAADFGAGGTCQIPWGLRLPSGVTRMKATSSPVPATSSTRWSWFTSRFTGWKFLGVLRDSPASSWGVKDADTPSAFGLAQGKDLHIPGEAH